LKSKIYNRTEIAAGMIYSLTNW